MDEGGIGFQHHFFPQMRIEFFKAGKAQARRKRPLPHSFHLVINLAFFPA
jgi:hypothetical protein